MQICRNLGTFEKLEAYNKDIETQMYTQKNIYCIQIIITLFKYLIKKLIISAKLILFNQDYIELKQFDLLII